jgi:hypothetical protein
MRARLAAVREVEGGLRTHVEQIFEIEGQEKPVCAAHSVVVYYD